MAHLIEESAFLIRDWISWGGCSTWKNFVRMADDAARCAAYDETHPEHIPSFGGPAIGGPRLAKLARKAEKRYRLAAWVLRQVAEGRDAFDAAKAIADAKAEEARIAALPRVNSFGRPIV